MDKFQQLRYSANQRAVKFSLDHNGVLVLIPEYVIEKLELDAKMAEIADAILKQGLDIIPLAQDKKSDMQTLAETIIKYALRASVKAHQAGNLPLELGLSKSLNYITDAENTQTAITRATNLKELMKTNLLTLTNITLLNITEMETIITECTNDKNKPKQAISVKKATGTTPITALLDEIDLPKDNIAKIVHSYHPELAPEWDEVTEVGKPTGIRHLRLIVIYKDLTTGVELYHVKGSITNGTDPAIIKYSTHKGSLREKGIPTGNYTLTSTLPGYITHTQTNIPINTNEIIKLTILLTKI